MTLNVWSSMTGGSDSEGQQPLTYEQRLAKLMEEARSRPPLTAEQVKKARNDFLATREAFSQAEKELTAIRGSVGNLPLPMQSTRIEPYYNRCEQARQAMFQADATFKDIMAHGGATIEARARAEAQQKQYEQDREKHQLEHAKEQEAAEKIIQRSRFLASGGTPAMFDRAWPNMWQQIVEARARTQGNELDRLKTRMKQGGRYML